MTAPDLMGILGGVQQDVREFMAGLQKYGPDYARRYAEHVARNAPMPQLPPGLSPEAAKLIRESVLEQAIVARMGGRVECEPRRSAYARRKAAA